MKKKRFVRLVMSYGISRNEAARIAARVGTSGSYEALFVSIRPWLNFRSMGMAFRRFGRSVRNTARAIREGLAAVIGVDLATGDDQGAVVHHVRGAPAQTPSVQVVTQEEHRAAHAAGRNG